MKGKELTMQSAIEYLGLSHQFPPKAGSGNYMCPVCGEPAKPRKKKLNIDFERNVFRCPRCDWKGGPFQFWAYFRNLSTTGPDWAKEVARDFHSVADGAAPAVRRKAEQKYQPVKESQILERNLVHKAYCAFLKKLELRPEHLADLKRRGLSDDAIKRGGYRSVPKKGVEVICRELEEEGIKLLGVPGFFKEDNHVTFVNYGDGYLIPCMDVDKKVISLQLRKSNVKDGENRYFTISSSGKREGTKGIANPHFCKGQSNKLIITEGPLKGSIITQFTGWSTISVLGVNSLSHLPEMLTQLKKRGVQEVRIAYDMDMLTNEHVVKALGNLEVMLASHGFAYGKLTWDPGEPGEDGKFPYKGLDDYLLAKQ